MAEDEPDPSEKAGPEDVRHDRLPEPGEQVYFWDGDGERVAVFDCEDDRFPVGSSITVTDNRDGRFIQVNGPPEGDDPVGRTIGIWWTFPPPPDDLIYRGP